MEEHHGAVEIRLGATGFSFSFISHELPRACVGEVLHLPTSSKLLIQSSATIADDSKA